MQIMNDHKKFLEAQVNDLQCKLVAAGRNHEAIREKHLSLERQLEFSAIEISTVCLFLYIFHCTVTKISSILVES